MWIFKRLLIFGNYKVKYFASIYFRKCSILSTFMRVLDMNLNTLIRWGELLMRVTGVSHFLPQK